MGGRGAGNHGLARTLTFFPEYCRVRFERKASLGDRSSPIVAAGRPELQSLTGTAEVITVIT